MTQSPYTPPPTDIDAEDLPEFTGDPLDNPRLLVWVLRLLTLLQVPLGLLGLLCAFSLLTGDPKNPEAYQLVGGCMMIWVVSIPVLIVTALVYRKCRLEISTVDRLWFYVWSALPTAALAIAIATSVIRY